MNDRQVPSYIHGSRSKSDTGFMTKFQEVFVPDLRFYTVPPSSTRVWSSSAVNPSKHRTANRSEVVNKATRVKSDRERTPAGRWTLPSAVPYGRLCNDGAVLAAGAACSSHIDAHLCACSQSRHSSSPMLSRGGKRMHERFRLLSPFAPMDSCTTVPLRTTVPFHAACNLTAARTCRTSSG